MKYVPLGSSEIRASVIGFGGWAIGGWLWGGTDEACAVRAIRESLDAGVNFVDTAPAYGLGLSEEIVGRAVRGRRQQVVLATKCGLQWHSEQGEPFFEFQGRRVRRFIGGKSIRIEAEESLRRLETDYIDLYQVHWQDGTTPPEETMAALLDLKREGKIRAIGLSNVDPDTLGRYANLGTIDADQEKFSMLDRQAGESLIPFTKRAGIAFLAYSPLAMGLLTGAVSRERVFPETDLRATHPRFAPGFVSAVNSTLEEMRPISQARNVTLAQLVLNWTLSAPGITHVLAGARAPVQALENARAAELSLTAGEMAVVSSVAARLAELARSPEPRPQDAGKEAASAKDQGPAAAGRSLRAMARMLARLLRR